MNHSQEAGPSNKIAFGPLATTQLCWQNLYASSIPHAHMLAYRYTLAEGLGNFKEGSTVGAIANDLKRFKDSFLPT